MNYVTGKVGPDKILVVDRVIFIMPKDHELQFPAMAAMQGFVNGYRRNRAMQDVSGGTASYRLEYNVVIPPEDWEFFLSAGYRISQRPIEILPEKADMVVDFSDGKILQFSHTERHVFQVCGMLGGLQGAPVPQLRAIRPSTYHTWGLVRNAHTEGLQVPGTVDITLEELILLPDGELYGVIGYAGRETALAASTAEYDAKKRQFVGGLSVIEIVPPGRHMRWLAKWTCPGYRIVDGPREAWEGQIRAAMALGVSEAGGGQENGF